MLLYKNFEIKPLHVEIIHLATNYNTLILFFGLEMHEKQIWHVIYLNLDSFRNIRRFLVTISTFDLAQFLC